jgi:hypothetical protein
MSGRALSTPSLLPVLWAFEGLWRSDDYSVYLANKFDEDGLEGEWIFGRNSLFGGGAHWEEI